MEIKAITRRWGRSLAIVIPHEIVKERNLEENEEVIIEVREPLRVKDVFGKLSPWSKSAQEVKDEARRGWQSKSDRIREAEWRK